jgi:hypothetical protein
MEEYDLYHDQQWEQPIGTARIETGKKCYSHPIDKGMD